jgi:hypothetical protein
MVIILDVEVYCVEYKGNIGRFEKEIESDILPSLGMKIRDPAFDAQSREIKEILISYEENCCYVTVNPQRIDKEEHLKMYKTMYEPNGWKWSC